MVNRRQFLQSTAALGAFGFGGLATGPLGLLGSQARAANGAPCRFVFVIEGNGVEPVSFLSDATRTALDATNEKPVGTERWWYRDYQHTSPLVIPNSGLASAKSMASLGAAFGPELESKSAVIYGLSNKIAGGGHGCASGALSCARSSAAVPGGVTIDAFLASLPQVRQNTPFDAVRLGVTAANERLNYGACAYGVGRPAPVITDPSTAYTNLFSSVGTPAQIAAFQRRGELIEFGREQTIKKLACFKGNDLQRQKLLDYKSSLEDLLERQTILNILSGADGSADVLTPLKPEGPENNALYTSTSPRDRFEVQFELATAALIAGLTNVAVLGMGIGNEFSKTTYPNYSGQIDGNNRHDLKHLSGGNQTYQDAIHAISGDYVGFIAKLARALDAVPEASGTMLDHTVIVFMGDNGEQHHSTSSEWPLLLVGGSALGLNTDGRTIVYPGIYNNSPGHRQLSSFFTTLAHSAAEPIEKFGNEGTTLLAEGPLSEVLA